MRVDSWLLRAAAARPEHLAVETAAASCTYAELPAAATHASALLAARGVRRGDRVPLALPAGLDFACALHACLLMGAVAVPVDMRLLAHERAEIIANAAAIIDEPLGTGALENALPGRCQEARHDLDALAVVIHTSGTTSSPRPVALTYGNLLWSALGSAVAIGCEAEDRWLCMLPLSHVGGLSILVRSCIYATSAVLHERFELDRALRALHEDEISLVSLVATTLTRLLDAGLDHPPTLRCALTGGGPVAAALVARARRAGVPVSLTYGLTESCSQVTTTPLAEIATADAAAGPPLFCTQVRIGQDEEILVRGPTVARGSFGAGGWLATGDLGTLDERGRLQVSGRTADTIVTGGENIAPAEIESVLEGHQGVLEAAVIGRSDAQWGEAVIAIVVARPGRSLDQEELRKHCAATLAPYKVPKRFVLSSEPLPRTPSGKLLRRELV